MPAGSKEAAAVSINRFRVHPESVPGEYRYRLLLVQTGQRVKEFQGNVEFVLNVEQSDRKFVVMLPTEDNRSATGSIRSTSGSSSASRHLQNRARAVVRSMQVRVFENGAKTPKLTQMVNLSRGAVSEYTKQPGSMRGPSLSFAPDSEGGPYVWSQGQQQTAEPH